VLEQEVWWRSLQAGAPKPRLRASALGGLSLSQSVAGEARDHPRPELLSQTAASQRNRSRAASLRRVFLAMVSCLQLLPYVIFPFFYVSFRCMQFRV